MCWFRHVSRILLKHRIEFIEGALTRDRPAVIPVTALKGAYHILTRYLCVPKVDAKQSLSGILRSGSPSLYPYVAPDVAANALKYALAYGVESWDGYLVSLTRRLGSTLVYTLDKELARVREITVVNPFLGKAVKLYHEYLRDKLG